MVNYTQQEIQELYDSCIALEEQERKDNESFEEYAEYASSYEDYDFIDDDYPYDEEEDDEGEKYVMQLNEEGKWDAINVKDLPEIF